jgi:hypothetical protein
MKLKKILNIIYTILDTIGEECITNSGSIISFMSKKPPVISKGWKNDHFLSVFFLIAVLS